MTKKNKTVNSEVEQMTVSFACLNTREFLTELNLMKNIITGKNTIPVLDCLKIEVCKNIATITATNLDETLISNFPVQSETDGEMIVNLNELITAVKSIQDSSFDLQVIQTEKTKPEVEKEFKTFDYQILIRANQTQINLTGVCPTQFPSLEVKSTDAKPIYTLHSNLLSELIEKTVFAATTEQARFTLAALLFESGNQGLRVVATDGHRLAVAETNDYTRQKKERNLKELVTLKASKILLKTLKGNCVIESDERNFYFSYRHHSLRLIARKPLGRFPNYEMILPDKTAQLHHVTFEAAEMAKVLGEVIPFTNPRSQAMQFQPFRHNFVIKTDNGESKYTTKLLCDFENENAPGFMINAKYFRDVCLSAKGTRLIQISYTQTNDLSLITGQTSAVRFQNVIMALRVGKGEKGDIGENGEKIDLSSYNILTDEEKDNLRQSDSSFAPVREVLKVVENAEPEDCFALPESVFERMSAQLQKMEKLLSKVESKTADEIEKARKLLWQDLQNCQY